MPIQLQRRSLRAWRDVVAVSSDVGCGREKQNAGRNAASAASHAEGSLSDEYTKVLEECSALEGVVERLDEHRRSEMDRIAEEAAMIDFTLNELGFQSALIHMDLPPKRTI